MAQVTATTSEPAVPDQDGTPLVLRFDQGTISVEGLDEDDTRGLPGLRYDPRTRTHRAEAIWYRAIVEKIREDGIAYRDLARDYEKTPWPMRVSQNAFPHQSEALDAWSQTGGRGVVVLPTGTGKTYLASLVIEHIARPSMVVTPTIDLMNQWYDELAMRFETEIGMLGGGSREIQPLTVTTYDSAYRNLEQLGNQFGLIVFDECHHLPGQTYSQAALMALAPFRLGLTATPERADNAHEQLNQLIGPIVYRKEITELRGQFLAEYQVETLRVELREEERYRYETAREIYREYLQIHGIDLRRPGAWGQFLASAARTAEGKQAFQAYREQKELALAAPAKITLLGKLLDRHLGDRILIFTHDNATVYKIARQYLVPVITHQTKAAERKEILKRFNDGTYPILAASHVLNEGVNVPEANVAVVLSGTGSVRQHVQRLGRILRKSGDKEAILYEVVTAETTEEYTSNRRRRHSAYGGG